MALKVLGAVCALFVFGVMTPAKADDWLRVDTDHFIIHSNDSTAQTRNYALELEKFHYTLNQLYKAKNGEERANARFELFLLKRREDMQQVWPTVNDTVAGFYSHCDEGAIAFSATDLRRESSGGFRRTVADRPDGYKTDMEVLYHEYAHHFMFAHYSTPYPAWFVEGFAEYFKTTRFDGNRVSIGYVSPDRYAVLFGGNWFDYSDMLRGTVRRETSNDSFKFYAQSWLLAHYILTDTNRVRAFEAYIADYNAGKDPIAAFEAHMGVKPSDLETVLKAYLSKGTPVISFTFNDMPAPSLELVQMPKSANKLLLWQSALKTCPRKDYKDALLANIRAEYKLYPSDPLAQLTYARAEILLGNPGLAEPILSQAVANQPTNAEAQYLTGRLNFARGLDTDGAQAASYFVKARNAFGTAYKLSPHDAPTLYYLSRAQINRPDYPNDTALNAAIQASNLAPSTEAYALHAATILIQKDRFQDAATLLTPVANNPHGGKWAQRLLPVVKALEANRPMAEVLKLLNNEDTQTEDANTD